MEKTNTPGTPEFKKIRSEGLMQNTDQYSQISSFDFNLLRVGGAITICQVRSPVLSMTSVSDLAPGNRHLSDPASAREVQVLRRGG